MTLSLEQRLELLEKSNRRWKALSVGLLACIGAGLLIAAQPATPAPAEILQAKRIEVIDPQGHPSIVLQAKEDGSSIAVWGPDHQHAAVLVGQQKKSALMLMKNNQTPEVFAEAVDTGGEIGVTDGRSPAEAASDRAALNISGGPHGFAIFHVVNGRPESRLSFSKNGGGLELRTPGSKAVTRVIGAETGGHLQIVNGDGQVVWDAPTK
ncbi:MAG TPA: hypothetical protein VN541_04345 [Tepidisphaeraceae bacterium]|nr:hypothetical protein [Tepidisphaeraceae bacterium]